MLLELIKKLSGSCQIRIFSLSKVLTLVELILYILVAVFFIGVRVGHYHLGFPIGTLFEWLLDIIAIVCLGLEFLGLQKKIFGIIVFSCIFRCVELLGFFICVIAICGYSYLVQSGHIVESKAVEFFESPAW